MLVHFPGYFHKLHVTHRQTRNRKHFVNSKANRVKSGFGIRDNLRPVQSVHAPPGKFGKPGGLQRFSVEFDVFCNGKPGNEHELLVYHAYPRLQRLPGGRECRFNPAEADFPLETAGVVDNGHSEQYVHEGALAGTVFAHNPVDFPGSNLQDNVVQHTVTVVVFRDAVHFQDITAHRRLNSRLTKQDRGEALRAVDQAVTVRAVSPGSSLIQTENHRTDEGKEQVAVFAVALDIHGYARLLFEHPSEIVNICEFSLAFQGLNG